ncbi:uncharacterized protein LOC110457737 [Mizuhopecten yessoensis]|uniref:uncharacterized protein LOC110457737 n=1 Tax=Mizuhopecten yessoensis TaxID=6573 RepID=UPI000B459421|nr:uncharacterized protein LOC110457737 [Mizuhopecten yessoensis]
MMKGTILTLVFGFFVTLIFHESYGQFPPQESGKWRNRYIQYYFRYICRDTRCTGFEDVCEIQPMPCLIPPCPEGPQCVSTPGSTSKPGNCPGPYRIWTRRARCNTDYGCYGSQVCCHGVWGSECRPPFMS